MISSSTTTPDLSRSSTMTESSMSSSYSSSLVTPASTTGPSFAGIYHGPTHIPGVPTIRGSNIAFHLDKECMEGDGLKGSPRIATSLASAVKRATSFAKRTVNVRRVISRSKRRDSVSDDSTSQIPQLQGANPHTVIVEELRSPAEAYPTSYPSLSSLREVTHGAIHGTPVSVKNKASISSLSLVAVYGSVQGTPNLPVFGEEDTSNTSTDGPSARQETPYSIYAARILTFVPWCILVGGIILLAPRSLSRLVATAPGTSAIRPSHALTPTLPPPGPRRFAYWAECASLHVGIFLGFICCGVWLCSRTTSGGQAVGTCVFAGMLARWAFVWMSGFVVGEPGKRKQIRLGEDDAESVWLALTGKYLANGVQDVEILVGGVPMPTLTSTEDLGLSQDEDEGEDEAEGLFSGN